MKFLNKLISHWLILVTGAVLGYFCSFNLDPIYVHFPQLGEYRMRGATLFMLFFLAGCAWSSLYFTLDTIRKSWTVRNLKKRIKALETHGHKPAPPVPAPNYTTNEPSNLS